MKSNDYILTVDEQAHIKEEADRLLREAGAYGVYPTPLKKLVSAAGLRVQYLQDLLQNGEYAPETVKRALSKIQGFLHREDRMIFVDRAMNGARRKFIAVHEIAHEWLPEQRHLFKILEDSESELDGDTHDLFERSANCFSSDVLFQLDHFDRDAVSLPFGIGTPVKTLSKRYGMSIYSTLRRYTDSCAEPVALLVCERPVENNIMPLRRFIPSSRFFEAYGNLNWPDSFGRDSWFYRNRPQNRFMVATPWAMLNGDKQTMCLVEAFDSTRQVFFFIYPMEIQFRDRRSPKHTLN